MISDRTVPGRTASGSTATITESDTSTPFDSERFDGGRIDNVRPTHAQISTEALGHNLRTIRSRLAAGADVMAVVKDRCYGHDDTICVPDLRRLGVRIFGVATAGEALRLRAAGVTERIVQLTTPLAAELDEYLAADVELLVADPTTADMIASAAEAAGRVSRVHAYLDTGMTRNGSGPEEMLPLLQRIAERPSLFVQGFCSHFATSEENDREYARRQIGIFDGTLRRALDAGFRFEDIHLCNSGGVFNYPEAHYTLVRPGISLYGYHPGGSCQGTSGLEPVMTLRSVLSSIRTIAAGVDVSYGRRYTTSRETRIATVPIGYGDGVHRSLTNRMEALVGGRRYPVVGTICMDEVMIDLGPEEPDSAIGVGDEVVFIGRSGAEIITATDVAERAGTISYEILTSISSRVPRIHRERNERG